MRDWRTCALFGRAVHEIAQVFKHVKTALVQGETQFKFASKSSRNTCIAVLNSLM